MPFELILFDADDTLFDFVQTEEVSFKKTLEHYGLGEKFDKIFPSYKSISNELWRQVEQGTLAKSLLATLRFQKTLEPHDVKLDYAEVGERYLGFLPETVHLVPGAHEICQRLSASTPLGIVTNGIVHVQKLRLERSGLSPYFNFMVISDEVGVAKPDRRIFDFALERGGNPDPKKVLMVGDRLPADILGAQRAGIRTCWFNPSRFPNETEIVPEFEIHKIEDVLDLQ